MADLTPRNSPNSPFSGIPGPEIPRAPYKGPGRRGSDAVGMSFDLRLLKPEVTNGEP